MSTAIDHVFICSSVGGQEADVLRGLGLKEGSSNTHPGQGTACRRFFFSNMYLELLWVSDPAEAQTEALRPIRLWERWSQRGRAACPYGIVLRPADDALGAVAPFKSWPYRPKYMPSGLAIDIALDTPLSGPEFFFLGFQRGRARFHDEPVDHTLPVGLLKGATVSRPPGGDSEAADVLQTAGVLAFKDADEYLLELLFDEGSRGNADLRPVLPLTLRW